MTAHAAAPPDAATLLYVVRNAHVLLILKKRGIGGGKINAPGGRIMQGETPLAAAERELREELGVGARGTRAAGEVIFETSGRGATRIHVFRADDVDCEPRETDEAAPFWALGDALPLERMWEGDRHWLPHLLAGRTFTARVSYSGDRLVAHEVTAARALAG